MEPHVLRAVSRARLSRLARSLSPWPYRHAAERASPLAPSSSSRPSRCPGGNVALVEVRCGRGPYSLDANFEKTLVPAAELLLTALKAAEQ
eukprot:5532552-Prymnesium_polylepis.1